MKRIFKNKFIVCIIAAAVALLAAVFAVFYLNKNDNTVTAEAATADVFWRYTESSKLLEISGTDNISTGGTKSNSFASGSSSANWSSYNGKVETVKFVGSVSPSRTANWFKNFYKLETVDNIYNLNFANVTTCASMFYNCKALTSLSLSSGMPNVTTMNHMFAECIGLTSLSFSGSNTSSVTDMGQLFYNCSSLTTLNVSGLDTSSVTKMTSMFNNCSSLASLNLSNFDTTEVTDMSNMFYKCSSLNSLDLSGFDTPKLNKMVSMFNNCSGLTSLDVSGFNTSQVTDMTSLFSNCSGLTSLDLSGWVTTEKLTDISSIFNNCSSLPSLNLSGFNTQSVMYMSNVFANCTSLNSITVSDSFKTDSATHIGYIFSNCKNLPEANIQSIVSKFVTSKAQYLNGIFASCPQLTSISLPNFTGEEVVQFSQMFNSCENLVSVSLPNFVAPNLTDINYLFYGCSSLTTIEMPKFNISGLEYSHNMFMLCTSLTSIDIFDNITCTSDANVNQMFSSLAKLEYLDISGLSIANDTIVANMLYNLPKLKTLVISDSLAARINNTELFTYCPTWYNETGTETYTASSPMTTGGTYYTEMPVCAHNDKTHSPAVAATCKSTGTVEYWYCNDCNKNIDASGAELSSLSTAIDPNNHKYTNYVYNGNATCIDDGTKTATCDYGCGKTDVQTATGTATGIHTFTNYVSNGDATCMADGTKTATCDISGCTATETITDTGSQLAHNYTGAAWSNNPSEHWHVCVNAGCTATDTHVPHTFQWIVDTPATVTTTGVQHEECTACGFAKSQGTVIPVATCAHSNTTHNPAVAATCMSTGNVEYWHCNDCKKDIDDSNTVLTNMSTAIDPNNHSFTTYVYNNDATCTLDGTETATCGYGCGATDTRTKTGTMLNHDFTAAPWSTGTSNHWHVCTRTGCNETDTPAPHTFQWVVDTPATVTSTGVKHEACTVCGYTQSQGTVIPVLTCAHNNKARNPAVTATCMSTGNVEYWYCSDCLKNVDAAGLELTTVVTPIDPDNHGYTNYVSNNDADCTTDGTKTAHCDYACGTEDTVTDVGSALGHDWLNVWEKDTTNHWHECSRCDETNDEAAHTYEWKITKEATTDEEGLMENLCTVCGDKDGEQEIAKLVDPNGEIDLPVDINVEFKVTQSSTDNDYSNIDKGLKRGYWAQLWYRNDDGTLGDEFTDKINCFLTLKIPTEIIEAIRGGEEINRDKIAEGLKVYFVNEAGAPVEVENFEIAMRDDDSWQIKFNYNEKFRAEVVFAADTAETPAEPKAGIPWWVWLLVVIGCLTVVGVVIVIIVVIKKKNGGDGGTTVVQGMQYDDAELKAKLSAQDKKLDEIKEIVDGGFNDMVDGE